MTNTNPFHDLFDPEDAGNIVDDIDDRADEIAMDDPTRGAQITMFVTDPEEAHALKTALREVADDE